MPRPSGNTIFGVSLVTGARAAINTQLKNDGSGCAHHWVIETPDGRELLNGHCKKCGREKTNFRSSIEYHGGKG